MSSKDTSTKGMGGSGNSGGGCPWSCGGAGGAQKCPKTGAVGSKAQCTGSNKSGCNSGKSK
ncbi:hypothetical protein Bhyg_13256 [Pseudolycoriella hygida]|uniref:Uncharacterized protein n=1 Tax=Pseudolycoriella hygida TaxID=35572 RepID=A0A9Q0MPT3_9DIPT|nr:hypothetical protein Bhyg_13256 [Pseudolycoriella hygida]